MGRVLSPWSLEMWGILAGTGGREEVNVAVITSNYLKFTINRSSLQIDWDNPTLFLANNLDGSFPGSYNVISLKGTSTIVIIPLKLDLC
jgi:hypothetical protein